MDVPTDEAHPPKSVQQLEPDAVEGEKPEIARTSTAHSDAAAPRVDSTNGSGGTSPESDIDFLSNQATTAVNLFYANEELNALPVATEPEWLEIECCLDTGSSVHAVNRLEIPGCEVVESAGSKVGQQFQAAGGSMIDNEGQALLTMMPVDADTPNPVAICMQVAKVTRPLISVPKLTEGDRLKVTCMEKEALVLTAGGKLVARFKKRGGLYVCMMRIKNPRWVPFARPA
jgi:hypothetical protein